MACRDSAAALRLSSAPVSSLDERLAISEEFSDHKCVSHGPTARAGEEPRPVDLPRIERAVREILIAIGENPSRDGLLDTPARVARAYRDLFSGLRQDPARHLRRTFVDDSEQAVVVRDIEFHSCCEHHLLPFFGRAHVAYLPARGRIVGLSKLARTVDEFAKRPQVQERLTNQVADAVFENLKAGGVAIVLEAEHLCMRMRGVAKPGAMTITSAFRGLYADDSAARAEIMQLVRPRSAGC